jgi:hypothetical protein
MKERRRLVEQTPSIHVREVREAGIVPGTGCVMFRAGDRFAERVRQCPRCFKGAELLYSL